MPTAKDLVVKPISSADARAFVREHHYSGKVANNSQLHLGVFIADRLHGAMQFGTSLDKRKIQGLVSGTQWHEFLELNRMAFDDVLPRNSESRALAVAFRLIRKHAPQVKWIVSFADGTQCGDGTIYRAAGFVLTGIKENDQIWIAPEDGQASARFSRTSLTDGRSKQQQAMAQALCRGNATKGANIRHAMEMRGVCSPGQSDKFGSANGAASMKAYREAGFRPLEGFQLRYIYFLDKSYRARLTVPVLPFSEIERRGAGMYRGQKRGTGETDNAPGTNPETGGASPTVPLLNDTEKVNI